MSPARQSHPDPVLMTAQRGGELAPADLPRPRMNYLTLINQFWQLRREVPFSSTEADLYFYLLDICNRLNWKNPFQQSNQLIGATLGVSEKTLIAARNRLKQYRLIDFTPGVKRSPSTYRLLVLGDSLENFQGIREECDSKSGSESGSESGSVSGRNAPDIPKLKPEENQIKPPSTYSPPASAEAAPVEKKIGEEIPAALPAEKVEIVPPVARPPQKKTKAEEPEHFAAFWLAYTRHDDRAGAVQAFARLPEADQQAAAERAQRWLARRTDWITPEGKDYRPYAATWLNKRRWTELAEPLPTPSPTATPSHATHSAFPKPGTARHHVPVVESYGQL